MATAAVSIYTAIQLARLLPMFLTMPSRTDLASKVAEVAIEQQKAIEAKEARDKLSEFAFIASHDLKAPLRGIANQARFLIEDHGDAIDPDARRRLNRMQDLCGHLEMLISTLLKYSRIGRSDAQQDVDPGEMVTGIVSSLSEFISDQNGEVVIETDLPLISADPSDLNTVFQNLIVNGLTYNESEEKRIWIGYLDEKTVDSVGMQDVFYVRDNGIGIAADFHDDVFRMFKRLNQPDAYQGGSGAGLAFVKKVIESNGGTIKLSSVPGHGTTFYFSFSKRPAAQKTSASVKLGRAEHA
ncbi:ATP-binding protein [Sulfitobacter sp.]|uniref:sensor histidine kinase n=1 Tax=Sulfitobacter sp. TaxID=1903071 RepID=UPI003565B5B3